MSGQRKYIGLGPEEVRQSMERYGRNVLTPPARTPLWRQFLDKLREPLIVILLVAGVLSVGISFYEYYFLSEGPTVFFEPVGIFIAILLATGLAFIFELKAAREFAILNKVNDEEPVDVIREGHVTQIAKSDVVVGDVVLLSTGQEVPADGQLLEAVNLTMDESTLTGEPSCRKTTDKAHFDSDATFASDMVLRGTKVMEGHGVMKVTAVGDATENGKVFEASQMEDDVKTPLNEQLGRLGRQIAVASYIIAALIVAGRVLMYFLNADFEWVSFLHYMLVTVMIAVTLVVVAVPEGLPMAVTLSLAYSMRRMLKSNNLVRKIHACETMGATTVICTDKTGTLTQNRMQVSHADFFGHPSDAVIEEGIAVNSTAELDASGAEVKVIGNPTEGALLLWLHSRGVDYMSLRSGARKLEELPFTTELKYMASVVESASGKRILYVKGAPEIVMDLCSEWPDGVGRREVDALLSDYQNQAMRTLGFAYKELADGEEPIAGGRLAAHDLAFLGVMAIADPVRGDVPAAVDEVRAAGIDVKIVTGDTPATAREIGRQIGLWDDAEDGDEAIITGPEFAALDDDEVKRRVRGLKIIARARPMDKKRLVESLQTLGEVVAVTGDGTNDAPALKAAHVGLSMGDGTAVAKEASDITIIDNSFASIGRAVMWGRSLYQNIQRFVMFQLTVNVAACLIVLFGAFMGMQSPLTVTQMLWVNLIMDTFAAVALASLPPSRDVMYSGPRDRKASIINPAMRRFIIGVGLTFFVVMLALLVYFDHTDLHTLTQIGHLPWLDDTVMNDSEISLFFTIFVMLQFWNMFNARAFESRHLALSPGAGKGFVFIVAAIFMGQVLIVELGGRFFNVVPLSLTDWLLIVGGTSLVLWFGEIMRLLHRKRRTTGL